MVKKCSSFQFQHKISEKLQTSDYCIFKNYSQLWRGAEHRPNFLAWGSSLRAPNGSLPPVLLVFLIFKFFISVWCGAEHYVNFSSVVLELVSTCRIAAPASLPSFARFSFLLSLLLIALRRLALVSTRRSLSIRVRISIVYPKLSRGSHLGRARRNFPIDLENVTQASRSLRVFRDERRMSANSESSIFLSLSLSLPLSLSLSPRFRSRSKSRPKCKTKVVV